MIKRILPLLFLSVFTTLSIYAQNRGPQISREEFRKRQEMYLSKKADFTNEEATQFFPVFFELEDKKKEINEKVWELSKSVRQQNLSEDDYDKILKSLANARINSDKLDYSYLAKFRRIVSAEKLYKFKMAEMKFHREMLKIMHKPNNGKENKSHR